jgi:hypothetical protein
MTFSLTLKSGRTVDRHGSTIGERPHRLPHVAARQRNWQASGEYRRRVVNNRNSMQER